MSSRRALVWLSLAGGCSYFGALVVSGNVARARLGVRKSPICWALRGIAQDQLLKKAVTLHHRLLQIAELTITWKMRAFVGH